MRAKGTEAAAKVCAPASTPSQTERHRCMRAPPSCPASPAHPQSYRRAEETPKFLLQRVPNDRRRRKRQRIHGRSGSKQSERRQSTFSPAPRYLLPHHQLCLLLKLLLSPVAHPVRFSAPAVQTSLTRRTGIGRASCVLLAARGYSVVIADIDVANGLKAEEEIKGKGGEALFVPLDVVSEEQWKAASATLVCPMMYINSTKLHAVDATVSAFGALHVLVNNGSSPATHHPFRPLSADPQPTSRDQRLSRPGSGQLARRV
mgnify:FL=1